MSDSNAETQQIQKRIENLERMIGEPGQTKDVITDLRAQKAKLVAKISNGCKKATEPKETLQLHDFLEDGYVYNTSLFVYPSERGVREYEHDENAERRF